MLSSAATVHTPTALNMTTDELPQPKSPLFLDPKTKQRLTSIKKDFRSKALTEVKPVRSNAASIVPELISLLYTESVYSSLDKR